MLKSGDGQAVMVAMSGGVDSSVTAALLTEAGYDVTGVFLHLGLAKDDNHTHGKRCCSLDDANDASRVADRLGIPFYPMNATSVFQKVMTHFANSYSKGETPNPCVECNRLLKFDHLFAVADSIGKETLATGHYAIIDHHTPALRKAVNPLKDQSYFLYPIQRQDLKRLMFPLGGLTKDEVRAHARRFNLPTAQKAESQDICFVGNKDYAKVVKQLKPNSARPGLLKHIDGRTLGEHQGIIHYTVGQRRGLGIALGEPAFVVDIDAETDTVLIGPAEALQVPSLTLRNINWLAGEEQPEDITAVAQLRYHGQAYPVRLQKNGQVTFLNPASGAMPGQSCVFYQDDQVLGGGIIHQVSRNFDLAASQA